MNTHWVDHQLVSLFQSGLGLSREQEDALWTGFAARVVREAAAWAALSLGLALASRQLRAVMPGSVWPGWFLSRR